MDAPQNGGPPAKRNALILDDEPIVCKRLKPALQKAGYQVETFTDGQSALDRAREKDFHLIVTDLKMEGLDGMEFLSLIKERSPPNGIHRHHRVCHPGDSQGILPQRDLRLFGQTVQVE